MGKNSMILMNKIYSVRNDERAEMYVSSFFDK